MGRIIEGLGGRYITAEDVGTTLADLIIMREVTCRTAGATAAAQQALPATAFGVFEALRAAAEVCLGRSDLEGLRIAVQGLGNVASSGSPQSHRSAPQYPQPTITDRRCLPPSRHAQRLMATNEVVEHEIKRQRVNDVPPRRPG